MKPFDEGLLNLKLQDACKDLHRDTNARLKEVDCDQKKTGQGYGPGWLAKRMDAAIEVFRKYYVPRIDKACREAWLSDHDAITPEFIRGIVVPRVFAFVAARKGAIQGESELLASRVGIGTRLTPALHHLVHEISRVQGDLGRRYEIEARELAKQPARVHYVTQAPAPIQPLRGGGIRRAPKPTEIPPDCPLYYPNELKTKTQVIFAEAVRKYTEQTQAPELCKYVISEMTPVFRAAVEDGTMKPDQVLSDSGMAGLLHSLLVYNCDHDTERFRLGQELRKSDEWLMLAKEILAASVSATNEVQHVLRPRRPVSRMWLEDAGPLTRLSETSETQVSYSEFRKNTLQRRSEEIENRLRCLKANFPDWRAWASGYGPGNEPPAYYAEIDRLEKDRESIHLELSKRIRSPRRFTATEPKTRPVQRMPTTINSPSAARRMETYIQSRGISQTDFAGGVGVPMPAPEVRSPDSEITGHLQSQYLT